MRKISTVAYLLIAAAMCGAGSGANAVTLLPPSYYPLPANLSDALLVGDAVTRAVLGQDLVNEPNKAPGIELPLSVTINVNVVGGLPNGPINDWGAFLEPGVKPTDIRVISDLINLFIEQPPGGICCTLEATMYSDSDFVAGVPIGLAGGLPALSFALLENGNYQDLSTLFGLDLTITLPNGMVVPFIQNPATGNALALVAASDVEKTPLPAAFPLFATALGGLGLLGWRRKRKAAAA